MSGDGVVDGGGVVWDTFDRISGLMAWLFCVLGISKIRQLVMFCQYS